MGSTCLPTVGSLWIKLQRRNYLSACVVLRYRFMSLNGCIPYLYRVTCMAAFCWSLPVARSFFFLKNIALA